MYKAVGHCRVSKGDTDEIKNSLKSQKSEIIKFASRLGLAETEIKWFIEEEARSAYSERSDWSVFEQAIDEACASPNIKYFLDFSQERFCRNRKLSQVYKGKLYRAKVDLRFASGDVENPDSIEGFVLDCTNEMMAEMYSRKVGIDTLRGCKENAITRDKQTGYAFKNGGASPFWLKPKRVSIGADKYGEDIKKTIWVENDLIHTARFEGKIVSKTMWDWARFYFIELRLNRKLGIEKARDILNELEIPAPRKLYWVTTCLFEAEKNESLIGVGIYNKKQFARGGKGKNKDKSEWIIIKNAHPALLTREEFEQLKALRNSKVKKLGTTSKFQSNNEHILIGNPEKFICKSCGSKIISSGNVYTCGKYNTNGKKGCGSPYFSINTEWLEEKIFQEIEKCLSVKQLEKIYKDYSKKFKEENTMKKDLDIIQKALENKERAQLNLIQSLTAMQDMNEFAVKAITKEIEKVAKEIEYLKKEASDLRKPKLVKIPTFEEFKSKVFTAKSLLTRSNLYQKRKTVWLFVNAITLDPIERQVIVEFKKYPFSIFMENLEKGKNKVESDFAPSTKLVAEAGFEPTTFGL